MYVYMSIEHLCLRRDYILDCHGGAMGMHYCALENITAMLFEYAIEHSGSTWHTWGIVACLVNVVIRPHRMHKTDAA